MPNTNGLAATQVDRRDMAGHRRADAQHALRADARPPGAGGRRQGLRAEERDGSRSGRRGGSASPPGKQSSIRPWRWRRHQAKRTDSRRARWKSCS
jgi:hypothetical protein